jgi:hypothetical protein
MPSPPFTQEWEEIRKARKQEEKGNTGSSEFLSGLPLFLIHPFKEAERIGIEPTSVVRDRRRF